MHRTVKAACAAFFLIAAPVGAQEPQLPPVVSALGAADTLPEDGTFETLGVSLGMGWDEVFAVMKELNGGKNPDETRQASGLGDNRGNRFHFRYDVRLSTRYNADSNLSDGMSVMFTTNVNETRSMWIKRNLTYTGGTFGNIPDFVSSLTGKYGAPSWREDFSGVRLYWFWFDGVRQVSNDDFQREGRYARTGTAAECIDTTLLGFVYSYKAKEIAPRCGPIIEVEITKGPRDDLMQSAAIRLIDIARYNRNVRDTDEWAEGEFNKVVEGKGGGAAPKL